MKSEPPEELEEAMKRLLNESNKQPNAEARIVEDLWGDFELPNAIIEECKELNDKNKNSMGFFASNSPPNWEDLKPMILEAIKKDDQPEVFEALLVDVRNYMTELKRTG